MCMYIVDLDYVYSSLCLSPFHAVTTSAAIVMGASYKNWTLRLHIPPFHSLGLSISLKLQNLLVPANMSNSYCRYDGHSNAKHREADIFKDTKNEVTFLWTQHLWYQTDHIFNNTATRFSLESPSLNHFIWKYILFISDSYRSEYARECSLASQ